LGSLAYAAVAQFDLGRPYLYAASMTESFTSGMVTAAFLSFLMRICDKRQAATQYAILTGVFALSRPILSPISGKIADLYGYPTFFLWTFLLAIPAYALLPWVYRWIGPNGRRHGGDEPGLAADEDAAVPAPDHRPASAAAQ